VKDLSDMVAGLHSSSLYRSCLVREV